MNGAYFVAVLRLGEGKNQYDVNSGKFSVLDGFSMFIAGIVIFKVFFAIINIVKWRCRYCCNKRYKIKATYSIEKEFKKLRKKDAESSDDADDRFF